ncbi:DsbA family protein [Candidatus Micrarchaeota archaeon]|nr:DsbA family protein [Candidatus Micrarchaeota archaeon]
MFGNPEAFHGNDGRPFKGNPDAKIVVIEYSDFQCPACGSAYSYSKDAVNEFQDQIRFEFRHFPLSNHPFAFKAAVAAEAANDQGKFWEYHDKLFENQDHLLRADLIKYAEELELDIEKFTATLDGNEKDALINSQIQQGNINKVSGTPTFFVNGKKVESWNKLREAIQAELNK